MRMVNDGLKGPLTWDDVANLYPGVARTKPMDSVFAVVAARDDIVTDEEGCLWQKSEKMV